MNTKLISAIAIVAVVVGALIYFASQETAQAVVTVDELLTTGSTRDRVQMGARVVPDSTIEVESEPKRLVRFQVMDIEKPAQRVQVVYEGSMPDTLKPGRDVILQGNYEGNQFVAKSLQTQCPSKYEPPVPGVQPLKE